MGVAAGLDAEGPVVPGEDGITWSFPKLLSQLSKLTPELSQFMLSVGICRFG